MEFNFNISELVSIIALLIAIIGGYVNTKIQITKLVEENKNLSEKITGWIMNCEVKLEVECIDDIL